MTRIILVRHGQTAWNVTERFRGRSDVPLDEVGVRQAELTARRIEETWKPAGVYSSPLSRATKTAEAIAGRFSLRVRLHPGLVDIDYGQWQGLAPDEVERRWPRVLAAWYEAPHTVRIPGGESLEDLRARCRETLKEISGRHSGSAVVVVGHTVVNRVVLLEVLGLGNDRFWHLNQDTCAINEIEAHGDKFTLVSMNDTCHLRHAEGG